MTPMQNLVMAVLPKKWDDKIHAESRAWRIRWGAASVGKFKLVRCSHCGGLTAATVERVERAG